MKTANLTFILFAFLINSTFANVIVYNGLTHVYSGNIGDVIYGEVILVNTSEVEERVTFTLSDAIFSCTTNRIFSQKRTHSNSSNEWFKGDLLDKVLGPKEKFVYKFTIEVPADNSLKGSYWSVLMVNVEEPISEKNLSNGVSLNNKVRYGIALITNINEFEEIDIDFSTIELIEDNETKAKHLDVKILNNSVFLENIKLALEIYNKEGNKVYELKTNRSRTFPGFCKDYKFDISSLAKGDYECILIAESREEFLGTNISLTVK
ncbi:hypothetical protein [uncultured Flavobacterium sp.]|uniref:hypothetical protein n=1 Tax=uncultured Flavobacterium sp. TaxID=165435 RepID=UPI0030EBE05C|tara:strand:+ start:4073 stop:4864 length:792 start_codon:yes stop_codon:yes gene_type:complete